MQLWQYLQDYSTCFGRFLPPSSGVLKTEVAASEDVQGRLSLHYVIA